MEYRPLYLRIDYAEEAERLGYDQAEKALLAEFAERGYVVIDLEIDGFDRLAADIIDELAPRYGGELRVMDAAWTSTGVRALAANDKALRTLRLLYGREPFPFQTLNFCRGTEQATHSDTIHFDSSPPGYMAGVWVGLEGVDRHNGPLHYYPGSHKLPQVSLADAGVRGSDSVGTNQAYFEHYEPMIAKLVRALGLGKEEAYLRPGQALIWSANLLHGGSPILEAGRSRHSQVTHYYFANCAYWTPMWSDPGLGRIFRRHPVDLRTGRLVENDYHGRRLKAPLRLRLRQSLKQLLGRTKGAP
jgi:hypothetical protein